jgi:hypothetical protein
MYSEIVDDPKVQMLPEPMRWRWVAVLCLRCEETLETLQERQIAFRLRISETELSETKAVFLENGFIDECWGIENWNRRQFISDNSTERVRKYRQALKQDETLHITEGNVSVTPQNRTEQNRTDSEEKQKKKAATAVVVSIPPWLDTEAWEAYLEMRRKKKANPTPHAIELILKKLQGFEAKGLSSTDALNYSIECSYTGVFEPKTGGTHARNGNASKSDGNHATLQQVLGGKDTPQGRDSNGAGGPGGHTEGRPQQEIRAGELHRRADAGEPSAVHPGIQPSAGDVPVLPQPGRTARLCFPA